jgi:hypothetical protein
VPRYTQLVWLLTSGLDRSPQGSPQGLASAGRRRDQKVSVAVPVDVTGTTSVETVKALPVLGMQKPGKRFRDCLQVAPEEKE